MSKRQSLDERFQAAVKGIQTLPANGPIKPTSLTKLTFYGLYKQVTRGPCNEPKPYAMNIVARAKWEAWDRCRSMTREQAMNAYLDEIRKILVNLPKSEEVLAFSRLIDPVEDQTVATNPVGNNSTNDGLVPQLDENDEEMFYDPEVSSHNSISVVQRAEENHRQIQGEILKTLRNLQVDLQNILERLNRLENCASLLKKRDENRIPLFGLSRRATFFIFLWPFIAFGLLRFFLRVKVLIRFGRKKIL